MGKSFAPRLPDRLVVARRQAGINQSELASRLGVAQSTVSRWESGARLPDVGDLLRVAQVTEAEWLLDLRDFLDEQERPLWWNPKLPDQSECAA